MTEPTQPPTQPPTQLNRPATEPASEAAELAEQIELVSAQQQALVFTRFDNDDAWRLGGLLVELARRRALPVTVDISRNGQQLFRCALPGSCADQDGWIAMKSAVVQRYGEPSYLVGLRFRASGTSFDTESRLDPARYAAHGGSFPITVKDVGVVGAVTVSGLPQAADHNLVVAALQQYLEASGR